MEKKRANANKPQNVAIVFLFASKMPLGLMKPSVSTAVAKLVQVVGATLVLFIYLYVYCFC
jgi:hypothetical protein